MNRKILTVLVQTSAIVALMAIPSLAEATQMQCGSSECATGAAIKGQSSNLKTQLQNIATAEDEGTYECTSNTLAGTVTSSQGETVQDSITSDTLSGCTFKGLVADIKTNASTVNPWTLHIQQPDSNGQVTAHLAPASGKRIEFQVQVQVFGFSVAHCTYGTAAINEGIQLMGSEQSDTMSVEGIEQLLLLASNSGECGIINLTWADLTGSFQFETTSGTAVVVHMS